MIRYSYKLCNMLLKTRIFAISRDRGVIFFGIFSHRKALYRCQAVRLPSTCGWPDEPSNRKLPGW